MLFTRTDGVQHVSKDNWHVHRIGSIPITLDMRCVGDSEVRFLSCQFLSNAKTLGEEVDLE